MKNVSIIITVGHFVWDGGDRGGANNVGTIIVIEVASNWGLELLQISTDWKPLS